jgi:hypothetical protein
MFEYVPDNQATWTFQKLPDIDPAFQAELTALAGLNPHGQPILRVVKGNEIYHDITETPQLKYLIGFGPMRAARIEYKHDGEFRLAECIEDVPEGAFVTKTNMDREPLGLLRYVIEKWTSPQDLEKEGRFTRLTDESGKQILREFPREGIYEAYFTVKRDDGSFRPLDALVLEFIKFKWKYEAATSEDERTRLFHVVQTANENKLEMEKNERIAAAIAGDYRLDKEEQERQESFWSHYDYAEERARGLA